MKRLLVFVPILLLSLIPACSSVSRPKLKNLVLIQGVHLGGSVWNEVKKYLEPSDLQVMDLARLGRDVYEPASLKKIAASACEIIEPDSILVGHSYGGAIANAIFGQCPEKIIKIIYVSGVVPLRGEKPFDQISKTNEENYLKAVTIKDKKIFPKDLRTFYRNTDSQINLDGPLPTLYSEWVSLNDETVEYDEGRFQALAKVYIYTEHDVVISLLNQKEYVVRAGIKESESMAAGHYPMVSDAKRLSELLVKHGK